MGVSYPCLLRGRLLRWSVIASQVCWAKVAVLWPLGRYWRIRPLVFRSSRALSLWCGVAKESFTPGKLLSALLILVALAWVSAKTVSPAGHYVAGGCKGDGSYGDEFLEMSDGKFFSTTDGERRLLGSYIKTSAGWVFTGVDRSVDEYTPEIRCSQFGFYAVLPDGNPTSFNRKRMLPFIPPHWFRSWLK